MLTVMVIVEMAVLMLMLAMCMKLAIVFCHVGNTCPAATETVPRCIRMKLTMPLAILVAALMVAVRHVPRSV